MNRKYENKHCGEKGLSTSTPYISIMKIKKDKDVSLFFTPSHI